LQMDEVTQQNAALVEEAAAAAESMQEQAEALMRAVSIFKLEGGRTATRSGAKPSAAKSGVRHAVARPVTAAPARSTRKLVKAQEEKDGDWKEF